MEKTLFAFGAALLAADIIYSVGIRKKWFERSSAVAMASSIFGAVAGVFLVFVARVFIGKEEHGAAVLAAGFVAGALIGAFAGLRYRSKPQAASPMLAWQKEWLDTGWSAVWLAAVIMYFFLQAFRIPSASMRDTFLEGDHLFVNKFIYGFRVPLTGGGRVLPLRKVERSDIVVFQAPPAALEPSERRKNVSKDFIKRCVAVGGDWVEIKNKGLYINGQKIDEPYVRFADGEASAFSSAYARRLNPAGEEYQRKWEQGAFRDERSVKDDFGPVMIPPGHYFCLGDNRDRSSDSRFWGPLPDKYLKGRAWVIYWPLNRAGVAGKLKKRS